MARNNEFNLLSLNVGGIRTFEKRKAVFSWRFNSNLVNDSAYCELLTTEFANWLEEFKEVQDKRVLWDLIKYQIRQLTIRYSKTKARERRAKLQNLEKDLKECAEKCDSDPKPKKSEGTRVSSDGLFWPKNKPHLPLKRSYLQSIII